MQQTGSITGQSPGIMAASGSNAMNINQINGAISLTP